MIDRLSVRSPPPGWPIMRQSWGKLLFLHYPVPAEILRPLIPPRLEIDTWEGTGWIGITPFTLWGLRPRLLPALPVLSRSHEINVRTYVHLGGMPGVWFLSLDATNPLAVLGARLFFHLPYYQARVQLQERGGAIRFISHRTHGGAPPADFEALWRHGDPLPALPPDTLDFFLIERYCLYAAEGARLLRQRIHHHPWPLQEARLDLLASTMIESHGLPSPTEPPLLHAQREPLQVRLWPLEEV